MSDEITREAALHPIRLSDPDPESHCAIDDHKWRLEVESGRASIVCVDPCKDIDPDTYDYSRKGPLPACWWVPDEGTEMAYAEFNVRLTWERGPRDWETGVYDDPSMEIEVIPDAK